MALLHAAQITPSKTELLTGWLAGRSWFTADPAGLKVLGAYRFDDPDGEVGIETLLVCAADGYTYQVPVTYRGAPLAGADEWFIGTTEHSVLGTRWVYDATGDPVYAAALASTILTGGTQAALEREEDGVRTPVEPNTHVEGSGTEADLGTVGLVDVQDDGETTVIVTSVAQLVVRRRLDYRSTLLGDHELLGTWPGVDDPTVLAVARTPR
jgi:hypothetical protein